MNDLRDLVSFEVRIGIEGERNGGRRRVRDMISRRGIMIFISRVDFVIIVVFVVVLLLLLLLLLLLIEIGVIVLVIIACLLLFICED